MLTLKAALELQQDRPVVNPTQSIGSHALLAQASSDDVIKALTADVILTDGKMVITYVVCSVKKSRPYAWASHVEVTDALEAIELYNEVTM